MFFCGILTNFSFNKFSINTLFFKLFDRLLVSFKDVRLSILKVLKLFIDQTLDLFRVRGLSYIHRNEHPNLLFGLIICIFFFPKFSQNLIFEICWVFCRNTLERIFIWVFVSNLIPLFFETSLLLILLCDEQGPGVHQSSSALSLLACGVMC